MKEKIYPILFIRFLICFSLICPSIGQASVNLPWSTTYNCSAWNNYLDPLDCDGLYKGLGNDISGQYEEITVDANYPGGAGGRGQRHYVSGSAPGNEASVLCTGGLIVGFNTPQENIWVRWYMRFESGFHTNFWNYKSLYIYPSSGSTNAVIFGVSGNGYYDSGDIGIGQPFSATLKCTDCAWGYSFYDTPDESSDGSWHCFEFHMKTSSPTKLEVWIDGVKVYNNDSPGFDPNNISEILIGSNIKHTEDNPSHPMYIDYDDIAISNTGYIGPIASDPAPKDTNLPSVSIASPSEGQTISGSVTVLADASDDVGVSGVQFKLDGTDIGAEDTTSPYSIFQDTTVFSDGSHTLTATARDAAGNQANSSPVSITISNGGSDAISPSVSISSPTPGQTVSGILTVTASASDNVGVAGVQFKIDGNDIGAEDTTSPYSIPQDTTVFSDGSHTLTATARDAAGNQATSSPVSITISNGGGGGGEILFEETFEDAAFDTRGWYDNINLQLSTTEHVPGSTSSVEFHFNQGATTPTSGGAIRKKFTDTDTIYASYYVKYSSNWEGSNLSYHPHEFYILTNKDGDWIGPAYNHSTFYIEQNEGEPLLGHQDGQNIDESNIGVDLTNVKEQRAVAGCNGDSDGYGGDCYSVGSYHYNGKTWRAGNVYFEDSPGQYYKSDWHHIEAYIKLNSISNGKGMADGVIRYWYDGNLIIDHSDVVFRTGQHPDMKFSQFVIGPFIGNGSPVDQTFWIDDLTVATAGPGVPPSSPPWFTK